MTERCLTLSVLSCVCLMLPRTAGAQEPAPWSRQLGSARAQAEQEVVVASRSNDEFLRSNALEAMQAVPERALPMIQLGMKDHSPVVRFTALILVGKLGLRELGPEATRYLDDHSPSVRAAAIYACRASGLDVNPNEIPRLLTHDSSTVRRNAAMVLGLLGDPSAAPMLRNLSVVPAHTIHPIQQTLNRIQFAEAILRLGDTGALGTVRAAAFSKSIEARVLAINILGDYNDREMMEAFPPMLKDPTMEVRLAAATTLAKLGRPDGLEVMLEGARFDAQDVRESLIAFLRVVPDGPSSPSFRRVLGDPKEQRQVAATIRAQAAFGLGLIQDPRAAQELTRLLSEENPRVRLSAAAVVLDALSANSRAARR